jgi:hypothetical protein
MKSNKQRRAELTAKKALRAAKAAAIQKARERVAWEKEASKGALVNTAALAPDNSYSVPAFVQRDSTSTCPLYAKGVAKKRSGAQRNKNGGTKLQKVVFGQPLGCVDLAAAGSENCEKRSVVDNLNGCLEKTVGRRSEVLDRAAGLPIRRRV